MERYLPFNSIRKQYKLRVSNELQMYALKSLRDILLLALAFFIENTALQVISSVKHNHIPLRDLFYELLRKITSRKQFCVAYRLSVEQLVLCWVFFCFLNGSKGLTTIQKSIRCLIIARALRVCLFSMTILPSPKIHCNFTQPINPFKVTVGGACNDLLYSGHVTIYTVVAISLTILSQNYSSRTCRYGLPILVWLYITQYIICTIFERHHYSIDMFLGLIVTLLLWQCKPLHIDLPEVPQNLFLHLNQLVFPKFHSAHKEV
ncbi:unnamed protein product [Rotaria socialis]|uniref:Sphingomyelin synthase-like domain-containing protein n=1 Tax=Rotaria socialis TaxID=392032 RepID=A0A820VUR0_9BILA|nr:unnamed protein product [Rotaria socialis]CAF4505541.1 unnamed protein product [Rotaria socialis]